MTKQNFQYASMKARFPVLGNLLAKWGGPRRIVAPDLEKPAHELKGKVRNGKVKVDNESRLAGRYGIQSIPTLLLFKDGKVVDQYIGATTRDVLVKMLQKHGV